VTAALSQLVERALVRFTPEPDPRYQMIEPVRRAAARGLTGQAQVDVTNGHREYFSELMTNALGSLELSLSGDIYRQLENEIPNLRS
jgi:hypothetical protein